MRVFVWMDVCERVFAVGSSTLRVSIATVSGKGQTMALINISRKNEVRRN